MSGPRAGGRSDLTKRGIEEVAWNFSELHEASFVSKQWEELAKEATAFSPESLARAILSHDSVKNIAKAIRGEFDFRANTEVLFDKVRHLLESGLDDLVHDWNETRQAELNRFVHSQKRASRKKRTPSGSKDGKEAVPAPKSPTVAAPQGDAGIAVAPTVAAPAKPDGQAA